MLESSATMYNMGKPNPSMLMPANFEIDSQQVFFAGDTESEVFAGRAAGCTVVEIGTKADNYSQHRKPFNRIDRLEILL